MSDEARRAAERELQLLAVLDRFAGEVEAGAEPRLAVYLERYPQFTAELTDFAAGYLLDAAPAEAAGTGHPSASDAASVAEDALSDGSRRALALLFPGADGDYRASPSALKAVAERRAEYATKDDEPGQSVPGDAWHAEGEDGEDR